MEFLAFSTIPSGSECSFAIFCHIGVHTLLTENLKIVKTTLATVLSNNNLYGFWQLVDSPYALFTGSVCLCVCVKSGFFDVNSIAFSCFALYTLALKCKLLRILSTLTETFRV